MDTDKKITITINLGEVCEDVIANCNLVSKQLGDDVSAEIKADVKSPDSNETKSIVCRAATEAIGEVKNKAQRYMRVGRSEDSNSLERLGTATTDEDGNIVVTYESQVFNFYINNFNLAVTDSLKSAIHKYIVDHIMWRYLQNQVNDKAGEYKTLESEDQQDIIVKLNARTNWHKPMFV